MCEPITMMVIGATMTAATNVMGAQAQAAGARAKEDEARMQAALLRRQADAEMTISGQAQRRRQEQLSKLTGGQRNAIAASGVTIEGSPTDVILDTTREASLDIAAIEYNAKVKAGNLNYGAVMQDTNAANLRQAARTADKGAVIGAISPFIGLGGNERFTTALGAKFGA
jgi:hypothetical protein